MTKAAEILTEAHKLLSKEEDWCKGKLVRVESGHTSYCLAGSLYKAAGFKLGKFDEFHWDRPNPPPLNNVFKFVKSAIKYHFKCDSLATFNDHRATHADILLILDKAKEMASK